MSYIIEKQTGDIVIKGFEQGIADDPYQGISDIRNINLVSVPTEASVNFSTSQISPPTISTGTITSASAGNDTITYTGADNLELGMAIAFQGGSLPAGLSATRTVTDGVLNTSTTVTSATAVFTASDVGKSISGIGIPSGTTIATRVSATEITISAAATATASGVTLTIQTVYWVGQDPTTKIVTIYSDNSLSTLVNITGTGTGTFTVFTMQIPKYFAYNTYSAKYYVVDSVGRVWSNANVTLINSYWTYTGNLIPNTGLSVGNGLAFYQTSATTGVHYLFVFHNSSIDYMTTSTGAWTYQWKPDDGTSLGYNVIPTRRLKTTVSGQDYPHETLNAPDNVIYYTDAQWIGRFFEQTSQVFSPTNITTYVYDENRLLPYTDVAQCLAFLGTNVMIGGKQNVIYPWDTTSTTFTYPILLPEYNVSKMITVNTTTFIFIGNRGRIYYTNGTNAELYKKIPDHISGTIEPYFTWGGVTSNKNQLYFSASVTTNGGVAVNAYGGLWGIDLDTKAIRLTNKLSYGTYLGYATAIIPNFASAPAGTGLYIGWNSGASTYGIDKTIGTPYTGGESTIDSDLIPIGTFLKPTTNGRVEFKLAVPLVTGETVSIWYRQKFSDSFTQIGTTTTSTTNGAGLTYSDAYTKVNFEKSQWIQLRAVLTSTASSPSYTRLVEMRLGS